MPAFWVVEKVFMTMPEFVDHIGTNGDNEAEAAAAEKWAELIADPEVEKKSRMEGIFASPSRWQQSGAGAASKTSATTFRHLRLPMRLQWRQQRRRRRRRLQQRQRQRQMILRPTAYLDQRCNLRAKRRE